VAWRGHLSHLLPERGKLTRGYHAAMNYRDVPEFVGRLRESDAIAASVLEFCILTATRSSEVLGARWSEIDLNQQRPFRTEASKIVMAAVMCARSVRVRVSFFS